MLPEAVTWFDACKLLALIWPDAVMWLPIVAAPPICNVEVELPLILPEANIPEAVIAPLALIAPEDVILAKIKLPPPWEPIPKTFVWAVLSVNCSPPIK